MKITFFGAAGEVTGSCHILQVGDHQVLLDCGMIQGSRANEARNHEEFPFNPKDIDAVILSHAHIDHSGRLPLLVKRGFKGPIYCQNATADLTKILLLDSANINQYDAERENRKRERKGLKLIEPLFTRDDAKNALKRLRSYRYLEQVDVTPGISVTFRDAGHILGSTIVDLALRENEVEKRVIFSGDLGQFDTPILHDPAAVEAADLVLMESTYGGRDHRSRDRTIEELGEVIEAAKNTGNVLVPAFAIGRSQEILYEFGAHYEQWQMDRWQVFLDSPMAIEASEVYWDYPHLYDEDATKLRRNINEMPPLKNLHLTRSPDESRVINKLKSGGIIIAGSGMCNGGRILHHLKRNLWRNEAHVVIAGYQAQGSLGRRLVERRDRVRIHGETIAVKARIHTIGGLSAHGDRSDLARWYSQIRNRPPVYLVHGEPEAGAALRELLVERFGTAVEQPGSGDIVDLKSL
ncbi:MAG: MBL fold metallo-hydrolase RNA specificity domain-containing protein [Gammaproteobacteria bacterium]